MRYVAMLRGIMPGNPNMRGDKLREFFEDLGFSNVHTVIASGNVVFDSPVSSPTQLEAMIEQALPAKLGFSRAVHVRSHAQLQKIVAYNPFAGLSDERTSQFNVTFVKNSVAPPLELPYTKDGFSILAVKDAVVFSTIDLSKTKTPNLMSWLEKTFGKDVTTRTYKTIHRILTKLDQTK